VSRYPAGQTTESETVPIGVCADGAAPDGARLDALLRAATGDVHRNAERTALMRALLGGALPRPRYRCLLVNLLAVYEALEDGLRRHARLPAVAPVCFPALFRSAALRSDIARLEDDVAPAPSVCDATREYAIRLRALAGEHPGLLAAHAYVRYLGDLSGGQALRRVLTRTAAGPSAPVAFYEFGGDDAVRRHVHAFRAGLAQLPPDPASVSALIAEARWAFRQHVLMFDQILSCA